MAKIPGRVNDGCEQCEKSQPHFAHNRNFHAGQKASAELARHTGCLMNKLTPENRGAGNQIRLKSIFSTCFASCSGGFLMVLSASMLIGDARQVL